MPHVSVVIITYNEEANIRAALESANWAGETVVLDSFSTDKTVEICREYTDKVYQEAWRGFSGQKARAVSLASNDWVFVLDSDERFTPELAAEIKRLTASDPDYDGYRCARRNHFMGREIKYGGWYPDYSVRLFDRRKGRFGDRAVHEAVVVDGAAGTLVNPMLHFTYSGVSDYLVRMDRYSSLAADELKKAGRQASATDMLFRPPLTFIKMFFMKQGFRDGMHGLVIALLYAFYTFSKYAKLWEMGEKKQ
ncbi:MAG: glycosyltransferase family 2 protein [Nitrospirae bacterium]|nr:glycosyltransferase family 2 protein [Nitrospirota bacterium]